MLIFVLRTHKRLRFGNLSNKLDDCFQFLPIFVPPHI